MGDDEGDARPERALDAAFFELICNHVAHPIFVKDRAFRFVFINDALSKMLGIPREQLLGKSDHDFFPKSEADFFRAKDIEMFTSGQKIVIDEEPLTDAAGVRHVLATTKVPMVDAAGNITHLVGIIHDITRLKTAEEELRSSNVELEERVRERTRALSAAQEDLVRKERLAVLGSLAGGVAHQIRNPLASIKTAAHVLRGLTCQGPEPPENPIAETVAIIQEEVGRANRIVTDLIDYARVREPDKRRIKAAFLVEQALGAFATSTAMHVERHVDEQLDVVVDPEQVQGALGNIVRNAVEAACANGANGTLRVSSRREGEMLVIRISDSGPGVATAIRAHLFEPLFTTKTSGLGLGLVTARTLVECQGGRVELSPGSEIGGATFDVFLPLA